MQAIKPILPTLRLLQLFCLSPFSLKTDKLIPGPNRYFDFYAVTSILVNAALLVHGAFTTHLYLRKGESRITATIDIVMMCGIRSLTLLILIESFVKRMKQVRFLKCLNYIDEIFVLKLGIDMRYERHRKTTVNKIFIWTTVFILIELVIFLMAWSDKDYLHFCLLYLFPFFISTLHYFQVNTYVNLIKYRFAMLNEILKGLDLVDSNALGNSEYENCLLNCYRINMSF